MFGHLTDYRRRIEELDVMVSIFLLSSLPRSFTAVVGMTRRPLTLADLGAAPRPLSGDLVAPCTGAKVP